MIVLRRLIHFDRDQKGTAIDQTTGSDRLFGYRCLKGNKTILETERGSSRSHSVENLLWKRLRSCRKTEHMTILSGRIYDI